MSSQHVSPLALITKGFEWDSGRRCIQEDVQEFSCLLRDAIEKKLPGAGSADNFLKGLFQGEMINYIECVGVTSPTQNVEFFYDLQLPVKGFRDLIESLQDYTKEEDLSGANQYETPAHGKQDAKKGIKFRKLPKALFFH